MEAIEHARPYDIDLPVRYRGVHGQDWRTGATVSVSRTEVVFRTAEPWTTEPDVELIVELTATSEMRCAARVARVASEHGSVVVTATVDGYRFQKRSEHPSRAHAVLPTRNPSRKD